MAEKSTISFCWMGLHKWTKWADYKSKKECSEAGGQTIVCELCNKKQYSAGRPPGHNWDAWMDAGTTDVYKEGTNSDTSYPIYRVFKQKRTCKTCGLTEFKRERH